MSQRLPIWLHFTWLNSTSGSIRPIQFDPCLFFEINKVGIEFTNKKITAYGGFSLLAAFFEKIKLRDILEEIIPVNESPPNSKGIYSKIIAYILGVYAGGNRSSHLLYLGCQEILATLFAVVKLPLASTTLTRFFAKKEDKRSRGDVRRIVGIFIKAYQVEGNIGGQAVCQE